MDYTEERFADSYVKKYEDDDVSYVEEEGKAVFLKIMLKTATRAGLRYVANVIAIFCLTILIDWQSVKIDICNEFIVAPPNKRL